jgi:hypothetical protein
MGEQGLAIELRGLRDPVAVRDEVFFHDHQSRKASPC